MVTFADVVIILYMAIIVGCFFMKVLTSLYWTPNAILFHTLFVRISGYYMIEMKSKEMKEMYEFRLLY